VLMKFVIYMCVMVMYMCAMVSYGVVRDIYCDIFCLTGWNGKKQKKRGTLCTLCRVQHTANDLFVVSYGTCTRQTGQTWEPGNRLCRVHLP
jgi:hypothetical protein